MIQLFKTAKPDPRILIVQVIVISALSFTLDSWMALFLLFAIMDVLIGIYFSLRISFRFLCGFLMAVFLQQLFQKVYIVGLSFLVPMFLIVIIRGISVYMAFCILIRKASMNELMWVLRRLHIPMIALIPMAVMYRYIPTIQQEIIYVKESLLMRGLYASPWQIIRHPIKGIEHFLIPLLFRSETISEELSAASLCKGLSIYRERTCCVQVKLVKEDFLYLLLLSIGTGVLLYINTLPTLF